MAKPYPEEFRRDVNAVARQGEIPLTQVAKDFGISEGTVTNWLRRADVDDGVKPGVTRVENAELRELRKRNRLLEQENEIPPCCRVSVPGTPPKMMSPLVLELAADRIPVAVTCRVLGFTKQALYAWRKDPLSRRD